MGFKIYMIIMVMLIPLTVFFFGFRFVKKPPERINYVFGYRTQRSMRNNETWEFAHKHIGRTWMICGNIMLPVSLVAMLFAVGGSTSLVGTVGGVLCAVQLAVMLCSIIPTERTLKKNFDELGNRR